MPALAVAYGRVSDPAAALAAEGRELAATGATLGVQTALLRPGGPALRLNSPGWLRVGPETVRALDDGAALRALVRARLAAAAPPHRPAVAAFVALYLDLVEALAPPPPTGAAVRAGVRHPGDAVFDAPLPLPNLWVPLASGGFVRADVGFWTGAVLRAVMLAEPSAATPAARRALDAAGPGVEALWWPPALWRAPDAMARLLARTVEAALASGSGHGPIRAPALLAALAR